MMRLEDHLKATAKQMNADIEKIRTSYIHRGNKGDGAESILRKFLKEYLPRKLEIGHGEIIDKNLNRSKQTDVVIVNDLHPYTFKPDDLGLYFIEGVSAVGESKLVLTSQQLESSFEAARHYKKLSMVIPKGAMTFCNESEGRRYYTTPPYFLFAFESQIGLEQISQLIFDNTKDKYSPGESIDGIFILDKGFFVDLGDGKESFTMFDPQTKEKFTRWHGQPSDQVLLYLLLWLSLVMPFYAGGSSFLSSYLLAK